MGFLLLFFVVFSGVGRDAEAQNSGRQRDDGQENEKPCTGPVHWLDEQLKRGRHIRNLLRDGGQVSMTGTMKRTIMFAGNTILAFCWHWKSGGLGSVGTKIPYAAEVAAVLHLSAIAPAQ